MKYLEGRVTEVCDMAPNLQALTLVVQAKSTHRGVTNRAGQCEHDISYAHGPRCRVSSAFPLSSAVLVGIISKVGQWNLEIDTTLTGALENGQDLEMSQTGHLPSQHMALSQKDLIC